MVKAICNEAREISAKRAVDGRGNARQPVKEQALGHEERNHAHARGVLMLAAQGHDPFATTAGGEFHRRRHAGEREGAVGELTDGIVGRGIGGTDGVNDHMGIVRPGTGGEHAGEVLAGAEPRGKVEGKVGGLGGVGKRARDVHALVVALGKKQRNYNGLGLP